MAFNVLIVDDSSFFQRQLSNIINEHPQLNVVGTANNGSEAIEQVKTLKPDIVTMDYEMPMMDGVTAVRKIMAEAPLPIMMFSSMTYDGARTTLDALEAGASDFMTKKFSEITDNSEVLKQRIHSALLAIAPQEKIGIHRVAAQQPRTVSRIPSKASNNSFKPKVIAIGSSTGGPAVLSELICQLPASFPLPILIVQHMPENFTRAFAERMDKLSGLKVKEGQSGDSLVAGQVLLAPGGKQMIIDSDNKQKIKIIDNSEGVNYSPCVDITFASIANHYHHEALALVLTGMGKDGREGARLLKEQGAVIWTQEKDDCLIYGMPMAVDQAHLSSASYTSKQLPSELLNIVR